MTPSEMDDLRRLQARVYGPAADGDLDAARRLARLSEASSPSPSLSGADPLPPPRVPSEEPSATGTAAESTTEAEHRRRPSWVVPVLWVGSVVATAMLATALTTAVLPPRTTGAFPSGTEPVAFLQRDPAFTVPSFFIGTEGDAVAFEEFAGMRPLVTTGGAYLRSGTADETCLTVVLNGDLDSASSTSYSGLVFEGCTANGFEASTQFVVTEDLPRAVTDEFPVGTGLQFVYDAESGEVLVSRSDR